MFIDIPDLESTPEIFEEFHMIIEERVQDDNIYSYDSINDFLDEGVISAQEAAFMQGYLEAESSS